LGLLLIPIIKPFFCVAYDDTFVLSDRLLCNAYRVRACSSIRVFEISFFLLCVLSPHSCLLNVVLTHSSLSAITPNLYIYNILPFVYFFFYPFTLLLDLPARFIFLLLTRAPCVTLPTPYPFSPPVVFVLQKNQGKTRLSFVLFFSAPVPTN
jgi:hypothetical protein